MNVNGKKILVVDDEMSFRLFLKVLFETAGYRPRLARDGTEGLRLAREEPPDLIVLDVMMPGAGGVDMYWRLKSDPGLGAIPVIMLSAVAGMTFEHVLGMLGLGAAALPRPFAYVEKPARPETMLALARAALGEAGPDQRTQEGDVHDPQDSGC